MRKSWFILLLLFPLLACVRETEPVQEAYQADGAPDGQVSITFSLSLPESSASTKALGEAYELHNLWLAVFGGSGYYKEYRKATPIDADGNELVAPVPVPITRTFYDDSHQPITKTVNSYRFRAEIMLSNTPRTIHFLGNAPTSFTSGKDSEVLPRLLCNDPDDPNSKETAFWQMVWLPSVNADVDADGNYLNPQGDIRQPGQDYKVAPETQAYFEYKKKENGDPDYDAQGNLQGGIALIRNWAKVILRNNYRDETPDLELNPDGSVYGNSNFVPISFAVVHVPRQGTFVPFGGKLGFIGPDKLHPDRNYQSLGFDELADPEGDYAYPGNLPEGTPFNHDIPDAQAFEFPDDPVKNPDGLVAKYDARFDKDAYNPSYVPPSSTWDDDLEPAVYLYERPAPSSSTEPSFIIIYGTYNNPKDPTLTDAEKETGVKCYYKVDLMDKNGYYPIFRNFKYQVQIRKITSRGHATPAEAAASAGSADVSSDVTASHLADISDGKRRMAIRPWMSYTFIEPDPLVDEHSEPITELPVHLYVKFFNDITKDDPVVNREVSSVWYELIPEDGGVIESAEGLSGIGSLGSTQRVVIDPPVSGGTEDGWRSIRFLVAQPDEKVSRTQTLRIYCQTNPADPDEIPLYRDIILTLQPKQTLYASCRYPRVLRYTGEEQILDIKIPDGLVESMFPLVFTIEPEAMSLTPNITEGNLPVVYGRSINPLVDENDVKPRFQFERTVTWSEYKAQRITKEEADESRWKTFSCYFKTNCDYCATDIWVSNKYFNPGMAHFDDYRSFKEPAFTTPIPRSTDESATVSLQFGVQQDRGEYKKVYVQLRNLAWVGVTGGEDATLEGDYYAFRPTGDNLVLTLRPTVTDGDVSVRLFSEDDIFEEVTLVPWRFSNVAFIEAHYMPGSPTSQWGSNVVLGRVNRGVANQNGKNVLFGYCTDPDNPTPTVQFQNVQHINFSSSTTVNLKTSDLHDASYTGEDNFYWARLKTYDKKVDENPASFTMSAIGYVEELVSAKRFNGNMLAPSILNASTLQTRFSNKSSWQDINLDNKGYAEISFDRKPETSSEGLVLKARQTYTMHIDMYKKENNNHVLIPNGHLYYVQFDYLPNDGSPKLPLEVTPESPDGSIYYKYLGSDSEFVWLLPEGSTEGSIRLRAPNSRDAVIQCIRIMGFQGTLQN